MKKAIKWGLIIVGSLFVLVIAALIIIPLFLDVEHYKPQIEKRVSEATGRPFTLGGDLQLSLFPWVGLTLSELHLGNPPGFKEKDFLSVKSFEVRIKLFPLLSKDIQVKRFALEGPRIVLEKARDGRGNWEGIGKPAGKAPPKEKGKETEEKTWEGFPIKGLAVGEFAITDGSILWLDHTKGERRELSDLALRLQDVSLDRPIQLAFSAQLDGRPLSLEGDVGPVGKEPGKGTITLDLSLKALNELKILLKGRIMNPAAGPKFDLDLDVSSFSPRKLVAALGKAFPVAMADPKALKQVALKARLQGTPQEVTIRKGSLDLDESHLVFSVKAREFSKPDVTFDLNLDQIDLDRYLPQKPAEGKKKVGASVKSAPPSSEKKKTDYGPLRRLVLDGTLRVGKLKVRKAQIQDLKLKISSRDGLFKMDPLTLKAYKGSVTSKGLLDVRSDTPKSDVVLKANRIQVNPLLKDVLDKDFLAGAMQAQIAIRMEGDQADRIKETLNGKGELLFKDGAIIGIDLPGMVRNVKATFGLAKRAEKRPKTDFSELLSTFTITNGVLDTPNTSMKSPILRVLAEGKADLVKATLDFRVEPKFVATLKGQGDTMERAGFMVPVLVGGTFSSPTFRPDLKGIIQRGLKGQIPKPTDLKEALPTLPSLEKILPGEDREKREKKGIEPLEKKVKGLIKSLPFGK